MDSVKAACLVLSTELKAVWLMWCHVFIQHLQISRTAYTKDTYDNFLINIHTKKFIFFIVIAGSCNFVSLHEKKARQ